MADTAGSVGPEGASCGGFAGITDVAVLRDMRGLPDAVLAEARAARRYEDAHQAYDQAKREVESYGGMLALSSEHAPLEAEYRMASVTLALVRGGDRSFIGPYAAAERDRINVRIAEIEAQQLRAGRQRPGLLGALGKLSRRQP